MTDTMTTTGIIDRSVHAADAEMRLGRARVPKGPIRRMCSIAGLQARAAADDGDGDTAHERIVTGYASVTEEPYEMADMFGPYSEIVDADAFARTLGQDPDVVLTINHSGLGLARTKAGTLSLTADDTGLKFTAAVDVRESDAADLVTKIERGSVSDASFMFRVQRQRWSPDYTELRILEVDLHRGDVSVVMWGANPATGVDLRSALASEQGRAAQAADPELRALFQPAESDEPAAPAADRGDDWAWITSTRLALSQ